MNKNLFSSSQKVQKPKPGWLIIYEHLLNAIVSGEINGGQRIVESELANLFGVSRTPIREALRLLEVDGLVELIPYRGVVVTEITPQDVRESLEIKAMIEGFTAWLGAQQFDKAVISELDSILNELEQHIAEGDLQCILAANLKFHYKIVASVHNDKLLNYYEQLTQSLKRIYTISLANSIQWSASLSEHGQILNHIKKKNAPAAEQAARKHALNTTGRVLSLLEEIKKVGKL
jgi:DNA-binding GntR family transcriptional regulator